MDKAAQRYLTRLRRALVCPKGDRERLLKDAGDMLENFAQENPGAFYKDYVASFGPPEDFAAEMLSNLDPEDVAEARTRRKRTLLGIVIAAGALLVLLAGFWFGRQSQGQPVAETSAPTVEPTSAPTAQATPEPTPGPTLEPAPEESEAPAPTAEATAEPTAEVTPAPTSNPAPEPPSQASEPPAAGEVTAKTYLNGLYVDADEIRREEAVAVLTKLGLMAGSGEGEFHPANTVTRAEATKLVALIMNGGKDFAVGTAETVTSDFTDTHGHWAEYYINYCDTLGIAHGREDGSFGPNDDITSLELVRMALCALGYDADAYRLRGDNWAIRTDELARYIGLYAGLEATAMASPATREVTAQILYNALQATPKRVVPSVNTTEGTVTWQFVDSTMTDGSPSTLLWERFGLDKITFD